MSTLSLPFDSANEPSPFGEDLHRPAAKLREEDVNAGIGDMSRWHDEPEQKKAKSVSPPDKYALEELQKLRPGKYGKVEKQVIKFTSARGRKISFADQLIVKQDLWGFADYLGVSRGLAVALQCTTEGAMAKHLRDFTDPRNTHGTKGLPVETHLREFLANGGEFWIAGAHQPGGFGTTWKVKIQQVTDELLDEYKARKRKK